MIITKDLVSKIDEVLGRGLCVGVGDRNGQMCVEAAICYALGEPHGDQPSCVAPAVREYKIALNDSVYWRSAEARANGMRALAVAQLGSRAVIDEVVFGKRVVLRTVREILPPLLQSFGLVTEAQDCASVTTLKEACRAADAADDAAVAAVAGARGSIVVAAVACDTAAYAARVAHAAQPAAIAAASAAAGAATRAAHAARGAVVRSPAPPRGRGEHFILPKPIKYTHEARISSDNQEGEHFILPKPIEYLQRSALIALETLDQLGSPGCKWLREHGQWPAEAR